MIPNIFRALVSVIFTVTLLQRLIEEVRSRKEVSTPNTRRLSSVIFGASIVLKSLSKLIASSDQEQENIIGDLLEEFNEFPTKLRAYRWLCMQTVKSLLPLLYKTIKARVASRTKERNR